MLQKKILKLSIQFLIKFFIFGTKSKLVFTERKVLLKNNKKLKLKDYNLCDI